MLDKQNNIIFVHFINDQIMNIYKIEKRFNEQEIIDTFRKTFKYLALLNYLLYIPTIDIIQSTYFNKIQHFLQKYIDDGVIKFVGAELSTDDIIESKLKHFNGTKVHTKWFDADTYNKLNTFSKSFIRKNFSTTVDITSKWNCIITSIDNSNFTSANNFDTKIIMHAHQSLKGNVTQTQFIKELSRIKEKLGEHAFLWSIVEDTNILNFQLAKRDNESFELVLASLWLQSYIDEYNCKVISSLPKLGNIDCNLSYDFNNCLINLENFEIILKKLYLFDLVITLTEDEILSLKNESIFGKFQILYFFNSSINFKPEELKFIKEKIENIKKEHISNYYKLNKIFYLYIGFRENTLTKKSMGEELMEKKDNLIGVIIALKEEFRIFNDIMNNESLSYQHENSFFIYKFDNFTIVALFMGDMGGENASIQTSKLLSKYNCSTIVNIGIAGALNKDVKVGDIIIADQVESYQKVAKAVQNKEEEKYELQLSGEAYKSTRAIVEEIDRLEFQFHDNYTLWKNRCYTYLHDTLDKNIIGELLEKKLILENPTSEKGHIASGDTVASSLEFVKLLKTKDRKYLAIEMEAGGVLNAIEKLFSNVESLIIRGISDFADERKEELDKIGEGALRKYAMHNAVVFLLLYLKTRKN